MALAKSSGLNLLCRGPGAYLIRFIRESHEGTVPHASPQKGSPGVDQYTEKVEAKGRKELEQLTEQSHPPDDDWVDVQNHETGEIGGPKGSRAGSEPTRFGDWERNGRCSDF